MNFRRITTKVKYYRLIWLMLRFIRRASKNDDLVRLNWWLHEQRAELGRPLPDPLPSQDDMFRDLKRDKLVWIMYRLTGGPSRPQ